MPPIIANKSDNHGIKDNFPLSSSHAINRNRKNSNNTKIIQKEPGSPIDSNKKLDPKQLDQLKELRSLW
jgi:hypothetical protein